MKILLGCLITFLVVPAGSAESITIADVNLTLPGIERWSQGSNTKEVELTNEIATGFLAMQEAISHLPASGGKRLRGTHAKGQCANGSFRVLDDKELNGSSQRVLDKIRMGIFSSRYVGKPFRTRYRFMNASGQILPDAQPDVRAISMDITTDEGRSQQFAFNNVPRFQLKNLQVFADVVKLSNMILGGKSTFSAIFSLLFKVGPSRTWNVIRAGSMGEEDKKIALSYSSQSYWSGSAFALGQNPTEANVIKLGSFPCTDKEINHTNQLANKTISKKEAAKLGNNYLGDQLKESMASGGICQTLFVQFMDETDQYGKISSTDLVENTTIIWTGKIHPVAELTVNGGMVSAEVCDDRSNGLNPSRVYIDLPGLGQINRARAVSESASRDKRET